MNHFNIDEQNQQPSLWQRVLNSCSSTTKLFFGGLTLGTGVGTIIALSQMKGQDASSNLIKSPGECFQLGHGPKGFPQSLDLYSFNAKNDDQILECFIEVITQLEAQIFSQDTNGIDQESAKLAMQMIIYADELKAKSMGFQSEKQKPKQQWIFQRTEKLKQQYKNNPVFKDPHYSPYLQFQEAIQETHCLLNQVQDLEGFQRYQQCLKDYVEQVAERVWQYSEFCIDPINPATGPLGVNPLYSDPTAQYHKWKWEGNPELYNMVVAMQKLGHIVEELFVLSYKYLIACKDSLEITLQNKVYYDFQVNSEQELQQVNYVVKNVLHQNATETLVVAFQALEELIQYTDKIKKLGAMTDEELQPTLRNINEMKESIQKHISATQKNSLQEVPGIRKGQSMLAGTEACMASKIMEDAKSKLESLLQNNSPEQMQQKIQEFDKLREIIECKYQSSQWPKIKKQQPGRRLESLQPQQKFLQEQFEQGMERQQLEQFLIQKAYNDLKIDPITFDSNDWRRIQEEVREMKGILQGYHNIEQEPPMTEADKIRYQEEVLESKKMWEEKQNQQTFQSFYSHQFVDKNNLQQAGYNLNKFHTPLASPRSQEREFQDLNQTNQQQSPRFANQTQENECGEDIQFSKRSFSQTYQQQQQRPRTASTNQGKGFVEQKIKQGNKKDGNKGNNQSFTKQS